jgi:hypothetical protein
MSFVVGVPTNHQYSPVSFHLRVPFPTFVIHNSSFIISMWLSLTSIPRGLVSPGSACLIAAVPVEWIATFPTPNPITGNLDTNITLIAGKNWLRLILASRKRTLREATNRASSGLTYPVSVTGNTVGTSNLLHHQLYNYSRHRWVMLYTEAGTNIVYVIGHPDAGALISFDYNNSQATQSQLTIQFTGTTRMPVYQGSYTLDNSVTVTPGDQTLQVEFYYGTGDEPDNTDISMPALVNRTLLFVSRPVYGDLQPVTSAPVGQNQIQWDAGNAIAVVPADYPIQENEQFTFLYR